MYPAITRLVLWLIISIFFGGNAIAFTHSSVIEAPRTVIYKTIGAKALRLWFYEPAKIDVSMPHPAVIFFHGGGWKKGSPQQFSRQARYLAGLGIVAVCAEYRLSGTDNTTPLGAVLDAKSAIRWLRENSGKLGIDPRRIAAAGGSAGGHLALSSAIFDDINDPMDDLSVSALPDALVLFNPVVSVNNMRKNLKMISPLHHIKSPLPPTIIMHGTADNVAPYSTVLALVSLARSLGSKEISVVAYEGRGHGFFNQRNPGRDDYAATLMEMVRFLRSNKFVVDALVQGNRISPANLHEGVTEEH